MSIRIAFDASAIQMFRSGVGHYAACLLSALASEFPEDRFAILSHRHSLLPAAPNVELTQRRSFPIKEVWLQLLAPREIGRMKPDVCHFPNAIAPLALRWPYVVTVHDLSLIHHPDWHPRTRRLWMRRIFRPTVEAATKIICVSGKTERDLHDWIPSTKSKTTVIPLGVRSSIRSRCTTQQKDAVRTRYGLSRPYLLYVGNIEPRKNLKMLIAAFELAFLRDVDLVIAGRRAWLWRETIRDTQRLTEQGKLRILEYVPEQDLPALYQSALAFVYPSLMEGFGLPVLEAMASGIPVLTSRIEPLQSLVADAALLASPTDRKEWTDSMRTIYAEEERRARQVSRGLERAAAFTWERAAHATMEVYKEVRRSQNSGVRIQNKKHESGNYCRRSETRTSGKR